jgi:FkbM family methyltransferase
MGDEPRAATEKKMSNASIFEKVAFDRRPRALYGRLRRLPVVGAGFVWLANRLYPRGCKVWVTVQGGLDKGLWMHLDPRYEESYRTADYESAVQKFLAEHLRRGDTFYEVGAHIGFLSLGAARLVGAEGEVVAFEADPENIARIEQHLNRNSLAQARVVPQAVWSGAGMLRFERASHLSSRNTGAVQEEPTPGRTFDEIEVEAVALDDYVRGRRPPSLIKIDVEGAEMHVLKGAERLISEQRPLVLCEVHSAELAVQVEKWLFEKGYALEWFTGETQFPRHLTARPQR